MAIQAGPTKIHVEADNKGVVVMLSDTTKNLSVVGPVLKISRDYCSLLKSSKQLGLGNQVIKGLTY